MEDKAGPRPSGVLLHRLQCLFLHGAQHGLELRLHLRLPYRLGGQPGNDTNWGGICAGWVNPAAPLTNPLCPPSAESLLRLHCPPIFEGIKFGRKPDSKITLNFKTNFRSINHLKKKMMWERWGGPSCPSFNLLGGGTMTFLSLSDPHMRVWAGPFFKKTRGIPSDGQTKAAGLEKRLETVCDYPLPLSAPCEIPSTNQGWWDRMGVPWIGMEWDCEGLGSWVRKSCHTVDPSPLNPSPPRFFVTDGGP